MNVLTSLSVLFPTKIKFVEHTFQSRTAFREWLIDGEFRTELKDSRAHTHTSSPFVWTSDSFSRTPKSDEVKIFIGGRPVSKPATQAVSQLSKQATKQATQHC